MARNDIEKKTYKVGMLRLDPASGESVIMIEHRYLRVADVKLDEITKDCSGRYLFFRVAKDASADSTLMCMDLRSYAVLCLATMANKFMTAEVRDSTVKEGSNAKGNQL